MTVVDEEQVEVLKTILHTEKAAHGVTAIVLGGPNPAQKIPGEVGGVLSFRKGTITEFWTTGVTCPRPIGFSEARYNVKPKEAVVMVARIYERFMPATLWNDAKDTPQRFVHRWFATQNLRAEDSWCWQLERTGARGNESYKLFGLVRALKEHIPTLPALSGDNPFFEATRHNPIEKQG